MISGPGVTSEQNTGNPRAGTLLVVTYHFPPDGAIGGLRWAGLTRHLAPLGWKSIILTAAQQTTAADNSRVAVRHCKRLRTVNDVYRAYRLRTLDAVGIDTPDRAQPPSDGTTAAPSLLRRVRRELAVLLSLPDEGRGWVSRASIVARSLIRAWRPDVVVSSGPPHSAHTATWLATRGTHTRWFIDLRDPWAGPISEIWQASRQYDSRLARLTERMMERKAITAAEGVIVTSRWLADGLARIYATKPVVWLPNGFDPESIPSIKPPLYPGLGVAHLGTLYGKRDLTPVVEAFVAYLRANPAARHDGTKLRIAGEADGFRIIQLKRLIRDRGVEAQVDLLGVVPRHEALEILLRSRLCLVLAQGQMIEVPGKLHEAIGAGVPTVVVGPNGSACSAESERLGAIFVDEQDPAVLSRVFEQAAASTLTVSEDQSARVSYAQIARSFLSIIENGMIGR
jgi:glycosyltransferase involved in cell wall biosynthesis